MAASNRAQIPFSVTYPSGTTTYLSTSPGTFSSSTSVAVNELAAVVGAPYTVTNRSDGTVAPVYVDEVSTTLVVPQITDGGGNIPGWLPSGSYAITVAAQGSYPGGVFNFESARGDGVTLIEPFAVTTETIAPGSVGMEQLTAPIEAILDSVAGLAALIEAALLKGRNGVPTGTIAMSYATNALTGDTTWPNGFVYFKGSYTAPSGWLPCDGRPLKVSDYPSLFQTIGYAFNPWGLYYGYFSSTFNYSQYYPFYPDPDLVYGPNGIVSSSHTGLEAIIVAELSSKFLGYKSYPFGVPAGYASGYQYYFDPIYYFGYPYQANFPFYFNPDYFFLPSWRDIGWFSSGNLFAPMIEANPLANLSASGNMFPIIKT